MFELEVHKKDHDDDVAEQFDELEDMELELAKERQELKVQQNRIIVNFQFFSSIRAATYKEGL